MKDKRLKGVSLFSSAGIGETYFKDIGIDIVVANELIARRAELYKAINPEVNVICGDITDEKIFDKILDFVKKDFAKKLTPEEIQKTMSGNVKLGTNPFVKITPLFLKKIVVRAAYLEIRKYTTITFSNIGRIGMIGKYQDYIETFLFLIAPDPVEKIKCSACTFNNELVFTFTTILNDTKIEQKFYELIKKQNIPIRIESNGVLDVISKKN